MALGFKLIISNETLYKEIVLEPETENVSFGTRTGCEVRLRRELFACGFEILVSRMENGWRMQTSEEILILSADGSKERELPIQHGSRLEICYSDTNDRLFHIDFMLNFEASHRDYQCEIDIIGRNRVTIGNRSNNDIVMLSEYASGDNVLLEQQGQGFLLKVLQTSYGIYKNGYLIKEQTVIMPTDFFSIADCGFYFNHGKLYATNAELLKINGFSFRSCGASLSSLVYPQFNRSTHPEWQLSDEPIKILDPAAKPSKPDGDLLGSLMPSLASIALIVILRGFMADSSNLAYILFSVCSMAVGVITSIVTYRKNKKNYAQDLEKREREYRQYITGKEREIAEARGLEAELLNREYPDENQNLQLAVDFSGNLYDRSKESEKFLNIRLGLGNLTAKRVVTYSQKEKIVPEDGLEALPASLAQKYREVERVPIVANLLEAHNLGVIGKDEDHYELMKLMILDLCAHHYSKEVQLFFVMKQESIRKSRWIRLLPHVQNAATGERNIIYDDASKASKLEYLYKELCRREKEKQLPDQWIVVFLLDEMDIFQHPVARFLEKAHQYRVHFISFANTAEKLPMYCGEIIRILEPRSGELVESRDNTSTMFTYRQVSDQDMRHFAQKLAPVYCPEIALESTLTKNITLFQLLNIYTTEDLELTNRWASKDITKTMEAPLGVKGKDEIVYLDIHEKAHGPHGLVAGTTGSGKSELLQTYVLSMALQYSPYEVGFVLIDFKGGGMANQFQELPHLIGSITDIDGAAINRSLLSIRAELDKRKALFAQAGVNQIGNYIRKFREGAVSAPLPHLIIIVDEFAELKAEQPEFMKELVSASRIGRSLGVHLILATQKPAGQVSEQIWSNSKFKLCLKVQDQSDSNEVIHSPLAAEIREPGRAYLQVGNNEIFELFQSAYSGAPEQDFSDEIKKKEFQIAQVDLAGRKTVIFKQQNEKKQQNGKNQLQAIVDCIKDYCRTIRMEPLQPICLPPLPEMVSFPDKHIGQKEQELYLDIGIYDAPESQYQGEAKIRISGKNTVIIGSSQYGKTNLLQVMIRMLASRYSPDDVHIYALDFGSLFLKNYENLPHIGGIVSASEDEKLQNLFKLLNEEVIRRRDRLVETGVSSFSSYREAGYMDLPYIVLLVDNFTAFKESYLEEEDFLLPICREGNAVGISVVIANVQTNGFGYKYFSTISNHIAFYCNESDEYNNVFGYTKEKLDAIPGRCLVEIDKSLYQAQCYLAFDGEKEIQRSEAVRRFVNEKREQYPDSRARRIPQVPETLSVTEAYQWNGRISCIQYFSIGIKYDGIENLLLDCRRSFLFSMIGENEEAKNGFINSMLKDIEINSFQRKVRLYLIDGMTRGLRQFESMPFVEKYTSQADYILEAVAAVEEQVKERMEQVQEQGEEILETLPLLLVFCNNRRAIEILGNSRHEMQMFDNISQNYRNLKVMFIFSNVDNTNNLITTGDLMKRIRDERNALVFDMLKNVKLFDIPMQTAKKKEYPLGQSDAFYIYKDTIDRVKLYKE